MAAAEPGAGNAESMSRAEKILSQVDPAREIGVELGPLTRPIVPRSAGKIYYADHRSTAELRQKYAEHGKNGLVDLDALAEIDLVLADQTLSQALGDRAPVDYVIASHVIEHLPDPISWLCEIADCLRDGGHLCLAIPDKRFTFDHFRCSSVTRELLECYLGREKLPTVGQVFDHVAHAAQIDPAMIWRGKIGARVPVAGHTPRRALELARQVAATPAYHDVHCTVYTPYSFCEVLREVMELDLVPYEVAAFETTVPGDMEFFATLRVRRDLVSPLDRMATVPVLDPALHDMLPGTALDAVQQERGLVGSLIARLKGLILTR